MQKLMKSLIVAFAYMSMPIMAQKDRSGKPDHRNKRDGTYISRRLRSVWYRTRES